MMRSLPSCTWARIAPRPVVEASVYSRKGKLKSGKAVIGLVVTRVLSGRRLADSPGSSGRPHLSW